MPFNCSNNISLLSSTERKRKTTNTTQERMDILSPTSLVSISEVTENEDVNDRNPIIADKSEDGFFFSRNSSVEETTKVKNKKLSKFNKVKEVVSQTIDNVVVEAKNLFIPED